MNEPIVHPTAIVGDDVEIGDGSVVGPYAVLEGRVRVGWNCNIAAGAKIGQAGFGYEWTRFPDDPDAEYFWRSKWHEFGVVLGDYVDVGANACIDRGSWRDTVIGPGTKIDNLVHIAHNVRTGRNCCIVAQAEVSGSCVLADMVYVAPGAKIRERLTVGAGSIVGLGAVVTRDVGPGVVVAGVPARVLGPVTEWPPPPPDGR